MTVLCLSLAAVGAVLSVLEAHVVSCGVPRRLALPAPASGVALLPSTASAATAILIVLVLLVVLALMAAGGSIRVLREYERAVVFRLGRLTTVRGPGLVALVPGVDRMVRISLRTVALGVPAQDVITRDNVP